MEWSNDWRFFFITYSWVYSFTLFRIIFESYFENLARYFFKLIYWRLKLDVIFNIFCVCFWCTSCFYRILYFFNDFIWWFKLWFHSKFWNFIFNSKNVENYKWSNFLAKNCNGFMQHEIVLFVNVKNKFL